MSNQQYSSIGSDNSLAPSRRQAIIWANDGLGLWRIYTSLCLNELNIQYHQFPVFHKTSVCTCLPYSLPTTPLVMQLTSTIHHGGSTCHSKSAANLLRGLSLPQHGLVELSWQDTSSFSGLILGLRPANEKRRYKVTPSLIGWAQTYNQPWAFNPWQLGRVGNGDMIQ